MGTLARSFTAGLGLHARRRSRSAANPDAPLIQAVLDGDQEALAETILRHHAAVFAYLRARLLVAADAEDLTQEVFLRCLNGRATFRCSVRMRPWLIGVARNVLREHVRRQSRSRQVAWTEICLELDQLDGREAQVDADAVEHLGGCLEALGPSAREALELRYRGQMQLAEIGQKMHRSEGAVKLLMYRARQALRCCLDRKLGAAGNE